MRWRSGAVGWAAAILVLEAGAAERPLSPARELARQLNQAFIEVADEVSPAVVVIDVAQREEDSDASSPSGHPWLDLLPEQWRERLRPEPDRPEGERSGEPEFTGQGSGMIMDAEGRILTNHHVVENAERIRVRLKDGREFAAEVRGTDAKSDLAVVQLKEPPLDLPVVTFGDSDAVRIGQFAIAIGAPFRLDYSVTFGHISAKGRDSVVPTMMGGRFMEQDFLQTDANINPGNSGGPLVNIEGEVIGVISMIRGLNSGIGFAIPSNLAREISARLISDGKFVRSWLGLGIRSLREMPDVQALVPGLKDGVVIMDVHADAPAEEADPPLELQDVVVAVDGRSVANPAEFKTQVSRKAPGSTVSLDIRRRSESLTVKVETAEFPEDLPLVGRARPAETRFFGMTIKLLTSREAEKAKVEGGLRVTQIDQDSVAAQRGVAVGDVITEINHRPVTSNRQLTEAMQNANLARGVVLSISRDGKSDFRILREGAE